MQTTTTNTAPIQPSSADPTPDTNTDHWWRVKTPSSHGKARKQSQ
jgi:hypothetical protein